MRFPGMDPYLESPGIWPGVHSRLIVYLADHLQSQLGDRYIAAVEERVYVEGHEREVIPDVWVKRLVQSDATSAMAVAEPDIPVKVTVTPLEVRESYLEILDRQSGNRVVTVIEVLSPSNKVRGPGRSSYVDKQREVLDSQSHLVEIDLLRGGQHMIAVPERVAQSHGPFDYLFCVNRAQGERSEYELYPRRLRERLPRIRLPLAAMDSDIVLDLQGVLAQTYEAGRYAQRLTYDGPCEPPLSEADQAWATQVVRGP